MDGLGLRKIKSNGDDSHRSGFSCQLFLLRITNY